ncbi:hypothetical protein ACQ4LE_001799 [Meloidogyne hapla]
MLLVLKNPQLYNNVRLFRVALEEMLLPRHNLELEKLLHFLFRSFNVLMIRIPMFKRWLWHQLVNWRNRFITFKGKTEMGYPGPGKPQEDRKGLLVQAEPWPWVGSSVPKIGSQEKEANSETKDFSSKN